MDKELSETDVSSAERQKRQSQEHHKQVAKRQRSSTQLAEASPAGHRPQRRPSTPRRQAAAVAMQEEQIEVAAPHTDDNAWIAVTDLPNGTFREVDWTAVNLNGRDAHGADFSAAVLRDLCALGANLQDVQLEEAELQNAALCGANMQSANLSHANLRNANLTWSNLSHAKLFDCDLRGANLAWADLRNVDLRLANLAGAYYNAKTQWPADFDPQQAQLIYLGEAR